MDPFCAGIVTEQLQCWHCLFFQPKANQSWTYWGCINSKNLL